MSTPRRVLPARPSLVQQRKQAKELHASFRAGNEAAVQRVRAVLPDKPRITLADSQFVLAREYGFQDWTALVRHIDGADKGSRSPPAGALRSVIARRDAKALREFLSRRPEATALLDSPLFPFDSPPLVHVAPWGDADLVSALLDAGADPNRRSGWWAGGFHALHRATGEAAKRLLAAGAIADACAAANLDRVELLRSLLDEDPTRVHERGGDGQTPLHFARSREVADLLLARGADIDARDVDHRSSPAEWMLESRRGAGRYELARHLVELGAAADIFLAAALGLTHRVNALLDADRRLIALRTGRGEYGEAPPSSFHIYTWTIGQDVSPLQTAVQFEQRDAAAVLLRFVGTDDGVLGNELSAAAGRGDAETLRALLDTRPDAVTLRNEDGGTALHAAAYAGRAACCRVLLEHGADANARDRSDHAAPMHYAAEAGHVAVVEMLADAGADVDGDGDEHLLGVIGWATCLGRVQGEVVDLLLRRGAKVHVFAAISMRRRDVVRRIIEADPGVLESRMNAGEMDLRTPLHHAVAEGDTALVELLLRAGADPNAGNRRGARPASYVRSGATQQRILRLLLDAGARPDDLLTMLLLGKPDEAEVLLRGNPALLDGDGVSPTPLHEAVSRHDGFAVRWLIEHGADVDARREIGGSEVTPLHLAAGEDATAMARLLLDGGADPTIRDSRWNSDALGWAQYLGKRAVAAVLEDAVSTI